MGNLIKEEDDLTLVLKVKEGDKAAFKALFDKYNKRIFALAFRMTSDTGLSEDITQEVFFRVWDKISSFKFKSAFYTWLYRVAINIIMRKGDKLNKQNKKEADVDIDIFYKKNEMQDDVDGKIDLERALQRIPDQPRKIFVLYVMQGYSHKEIQDLTGIAEGTSKCHLSRARELLKKELSL